MSLSGSAQLPRSDLPGRQHSGWSLGSCSTTAWSLGLCLPSTCECPPCPHCGTVSLLFGSIKTTHFSLCPQDFGITSLMNLGFHESQEEGVLLNLWLPACSTNLPEPRGHQELGFLLKRGRICATTKNEIQILIIMSINYLNHNPIHPLNSGFRSVTRLDKLSLP